MQCLKCSHKNPGSVLYCQKCGEKMDLTADEVSQFYEQKIRAEKRDAMFTYALRTLVLAVVVFMVAVTVMVLGGGDPPVTSYIPSAAKDTEFMKVPYRVAPTMNPILIPIAEVRK